mmetsp:Transcript_6129/g.15162  ORF Transcript_6129/g.15162 Transcript_6129/m.15162 type:complete len:302 (+) Transcript_6129:3-908(+)
MASGSAAAAGDASGSAAAGAGADPKKQVIKATKEIRAARMLAQVCERAFMEHQLAATHFKFYNFWVFFIPLNLLIAVTSVLSFIAGEQSSVSIDSTLLNIVVGCVAAFGVFWNSCDRMLNYKSRADMHTGAKMVCKELLADLDFSLIKCSTEDAEQILKEVDLDAIKTKLDQVQESCTSAVPDAINQAFKQVNSLVPYELGIKGLADGDGEDIQTIRIANVLLCKEIAKSKLWPMKLPGANVHKQAEKALRDVLKKRDLLDVREEEEKENKKEKEKKGKMQDGPSSVSDAKLASSAADSVA